MRTKIILFRFFMVYLFGWSFTAANAANVLGTTELSAPFYNQLSPFLYEADAIVSTPLQFNCNSYIDFLTKITIQPDGSTAWPGNDDATLEEYFHTDLTNASDQAILNLISRIHNCADNLNPADSNSVFQKALLETYGIDPLTRIMASNDAAPAHIAAKNQERLDAISSIPACNDPQTITMLKQAVSNSPTGKTEGVVLLDAKDFNDISANTILFLPNERSCQADALFNDGERSISYYIKWFDQSNGVLSVEISGLQ